MPKFLSKHHRFVGVSYNCTLRTLVLSISKYTCFLQDRRIGDHIENEHFQYKERIVAEMVYCSIYSQVSKLSFILPKEAFETSDISRQDNNGRLL